MKSAEARRKTDESRGARIVQLTPEGRGAVAVLLVSGPQAAEQVGRYFFAHGDWPLAVRPHHRIFHGRWGSADGEDVVVCRHSECEVEIHCHGGRAAIDRICADLTAAGCELLAWTDWLSQHVPSRIHVDAATLLAKATTERTAAILLDQIDGAFEGALSHIDRDLVAGRIREAAAVIDDLLARSSIGLHLVEPWRVVLAGPPNVGKSSLINALVGYSRSIVFDQPGTTRDVITVATALDGWPIQLCDTAGLQASDEPLEQAGIALARRQMAAADGIVLVFDASEQSAEDQELLASEFPNAIVVVNKIDLVSANEIQSITAAQLSHRLVATSAMTGQGIDELAAAIVQHLVCPGPRPGDAVPFTAEQVPQLTAARAALARSDIVGARQAIAELTAD
jgi:tRNA modification GTPase